MSDTVIFLNHSTFGQAMPHLTGRVDYKQKSTGRFSEEIKYETKGNIQDKKKQM